MFVPVLRCGRNHCQYRGIFLVHNQYQKGSAILCEPNWRGNRQQACGEWCGYGIGLTTSQMAEESPLPSPCAMVCFRAGLE